MASHVGSYSDAIGLIDMGFLEISSKDVSEILDNTMQLIDALVVQNCTKSRW